jgi:hypothetical protein
MVDLKLFHLALGEGHIANYRLFKAIYTLSNFLIKGKNWDIFIYLPQPYI